MQTKKRENKKNIYFILELHNRKYGLKNKDERMNVENCIDGYYINFAYLFTTSR